MKKRLFYVIIILSVILVTITGVLSSYVYYEFYLNESKEQLKTIAKMLSKDDWDTFEAIHKSADNILTSSNYHIRITIVDKSGDVIFDNVANYNAIENHGNRPEIMNAFKYGTGEDTRLSRTLENDTYYYAMKLNDNRVLRLSRELSSIRKMFTNIIPIILSLFLFIICVAFIVASSISKKIIKPITNMTKSIDELIEDDELNIEIDNYEELEPLAIKIKEQKSIINEYINEIKYERDTIGIITENMKEGLILLNSEKNILSINSSGKRMVGNRKFTLKGRKNIIELTRSEQILENVDKALTKNKHIVNDMDLNRFHYRYYYSPVSETSHIVDGLVILIEDITSQKKAEIMRREFSANVSHELKTPLTTMIGFAQMIKEGLITETESIKKYCGLINNEGLRLISLIEDIIRLSKIEEEIDIDSSNFIKLNDLAYDVYNLLSSKAEKNNIKITVNSENVGMYANENYINELLYNIIENGIKYNKPNGEVIVNIYKKDKIYIVVKDTGFGIPEEHIDRIFERFYRVDKSRYKETGGTGLGLSIVKHIVE
ncbi:MAG: histidine kinase dimerization/phospho-acceptor domain-containing protein, partial [Tissierellia bacterium]|nr:histidine kinase dimerization/phospho-acceptor domain-containing protein [Tissierellia bacterium]